MGDSEEILVNDMTNVVAAGPSEYSFQYIPDQQPENVSLNEVRRSIEIGEKVTVKGRIKKGENPEHIVFSLNVTSHEVQNLIFCCVDICCKG